MKIAIANSRLSKTWINKEISWDEVIARLLTTQKTVETIEEILKMKKSEQDIIKDVGGYVMGHLKQGLRRAGYVLSLSCITLDMDFATPGIENYIRSIFRYKGCIYGTHKYTQANPRLRIILPMFRDVNEEEY